MNTFHSPDSSNPLLEQKNKNRARVRLAVFIVLAIHVAVLVPLLVQGCKREEAPPPPETAAPPAVEETNLPPAETQTNLVLPPLAPVPTNVAPSVTPAEAAPPPAGTEYIVAKGDTFYGIARKYGVSIKAITEVNQGVEPTKLKVGQKLTIPAPPAAASATATVESAGGETTYVVKSGDTLSKIAREHGTTVAAIRSINKLNTDRIKVGQKLKIPAKEVSPAPATETAPTPPPTAVPTLPPPTTTR